MDVIPSGLNVCLLGSDVSAAAAEKDAVQRPVIERNEKSINILY